MLADRGDFLSESSMGNLPNWKPSRLTSPIGMLARAPRCFESQIPPPIEISNWELGTFIARLLLWVTFLAWYLCCYFGTFYNTAEHLFTIITDYHYKSRMNTTPTVSWHNLHLYLELFSSRKGKIHSVLPSCLHASLSHTHTYVHTYSTPAFWAIYHLTGLSFRGGLNY